MPNLARFQFLDPASRDFYPDWDLFAAMCVGIMRTEAGRDPHDRGLQNLVGELSTQSETFRRLWADHNVRTHGAAAHYQCGGVGGRIKHACHARPAPAPTAAFLAAA